MYLNMCFKFFGLSKACSLLLNMPEIIFANSNTVFIFHFLRYNLFFYSNEFQMHKMFAG